MIPAPLLELAAGTALGACAYVALMRTVALGGRVRETPGGAGRWRRLADARPSLQSLALAGLGGVTAAGIMFALIGLPLPSVSVGLGGGAAGVSLGSLRAGRRRAAQREGLLESIDLLAQLLPAGHGVRQALEALSKSGPTPVREELAQIMDRQRQVSLDQALAEAQRRIRQPLFTLLAAALTVGSRSGGRITPLLEELSRSAHQIDVTQRQLRAEQAQGRLGALVIALMPLLLLSMLRLVNPQYLAPYQTVGGQLLLSLLLGLICCGYGWMLWILRLPEPDLTEFRLQGPVSPAAAPGAMG